MSRAGGALARAVIGLFLLTSVACFRAGRATPALPRWSADLPAPRIAGETGTTDTIAAGVLHRSFLVRQEPWVIHVLDVDLAACRTAVAIKGASGAAGRTKTSALVGSVLDAINRVAAGVNADFFLFDPPGVPTGAHISGGKVITGPGARPVFAIDTAGRPWIGTLTATGTAISGLDSLPIVAWNRLSPDGLSWFDARYGSTVDTSTGSMRVVLGDTRGLVQSIDTTGAVATIPSPGGVLVLGNRAPAAMRQRLLLAARSRAQFSVTTRLHPIHPREVVGGFPVLVRDSLEVSGLDSAGAPTFAPVRHPRTIVGVAARGRRLLLITIDGRQAGYSVGTTNRESARVALELGATEAINLDGGGSTAMAIARSRGDSIAIEVVNKPSDAQGERAVGNALVIRKGTTKRC